MCESQGDAMEKTLRICFPQATQANSCSKPAQMDQNMDIYRRKMPEQKSIANFQLVNLTQSASMSHTDAVHQADDAWLITGEPIKRVLVERKKPSNGSSSVPSASTPVFAKLNF